MRSIEPMTSWCNGLVRNALPRFGHPIRNGFSPLEVMRCALVFCSSGLGFVRLVQQKQAGIVFALKDVKALIAYFLDGFLVIQD